METNIIKFSRKDSKNFFKTLNIRVNNYFKEQNITKKGNWKIWLKNIYNVLLANNAICFNIYNDNSHLDSNITFSYYGHWFSRCWNERYA
jgi:hypothetical protein